MPSRRWEVPDHEDKDVVLHETTWTHIIEGHPEMVGNEHAIKKAIFDPGMVVKTEHSPSHADGCRRTASKLGVHPGYPGLYVHVAMEYGTASEGNFVVTAYSSPSPPKGELIFVALP